MQSSGLDMSEEAFTSELQGEKLRSEADGVKPRFILETSALTADTSRANYLLKPAGGTEIELRFGSPLKDAGFSFSLPVPSTTMS